MAVPDRRRVRVVRILAARPPLLSCTDLAGSLATLVYADSAGQVSLTAQVEDVDALCGLVADLIADADLVREIRHRVAVSSLGSAPDRQIVVTVPTPTGVLVTLSVDATPGQRQGVHRTLIESLVEAVDDDDAAEVMDALLALGAEGSTLNGAGSGE